MKCQKCSVELQDGVFFCRECGAKVETVESMKRFCRECGSKLLYGVKFCPNCGANVNVFSDVSVDNSSGKRTFSEETVVADENTSCATDSTKKAASNEFTGYQENQLDKKTKIHSLKKTSGDTIKEKAIGFWNDLDIFCKIVAVAMVVAIILLLVSLLNHKGIAIFLSIIQIGGLTTATFIHNGVMKSTSNWLKYLVLVASIFFTVLNVISYSSGTGEKLEINNTTITPVTQTT